MNSEFETGDVVKKNDWREAARVAGEAFLVNLPLAICAAVVMLLAFLG